ncbi:Cu2+-exporting ATPase [Loktanella fryxellensis]|uniref:Cu2+-exporting ATPase n=1 Tax=Loktanella fryxellensis TaxID=245187 RepID=A0A1H8HIM1_9RHOB|nr:heavy metal translocating P-type ATPase [Loktanella fryxellensis]SEN55956.1 Cu2+-exporting ATPase [Loktanella fryxellensis]
MPDGHGLCILSLPGLRCGGCVAAVERALTEPPDVVGVRVNPTLKPMVVTLRDPDPDPAPVIAQLVAPCYRAVPAAVDDATDDGDAAGRRLVRVMAVAGFGTANIMLLSVGVWPGASDQTRDTFRMISALIAVPVVAYAGQPFFRSALQAMRTGRLNMDVPLAVGVLLALLLKLLETAHGEEEAVFDAAVTLLFLLLCGRFPDHLMRERARGAVSGLARLSPRGAMWRQADGALTDVRLQAIVPDAVIWIGPDQRNPVDVRIIAGSTDLDRSLVTGEAMCVTAGPGDTLKAGTPNLTGTIEARVLRSAADSFLTRMMRMQNEADIKGGRGTDLRIADRATPLDPPHVHIPALATFAVWVAVTDDWHASAFGGISALIITCPCAPGLAVPVAHVVAAGRLMRMGIPMKDGSALERLAEIDCAVFDKTGTLTIGAAAVACRSDDPALRPLAKALALRPRHPTARAIAAGIPDWFCPLDDATEVPGLGIAGHVGGCVLRPGRADGVALIAPQAAGRASPVFACADGPTLSFGIVEGLRPGAQDAVATLVAAGIAVSILSGDIAARTAAVAAQLHLTDVQSGTTPADKIAALDALRAAGHHALMVGCGLNDAAALAAAHGSMAPGSASDAGRTAADFIILRDGLDAVPAAWRMACDTARIVRQNFALAIACNCMAIPLAMAGLVTPLIAAATMSTLSVIVIADALRPHRAPPTDTTAAKHPAPAQVPA